MKSVILQTASRFLLVLLVLYSIFELLRGHDEPGGGFVGGLLAAAGFALYGLAYDPDAARATLRADPRTLVGVGLSTAAVSGCVALLRGAPFLTAQWLPLTLPDGTKPGTALLFDIGVYITVLGAALLILPVVRKD